MTTNVLILCTHNAARSILAEAMLNHWARRLHKDVCAYSAGSRPRGSVDADALAVLRAADVETTGLHPKNWYELVGAGVPSMRIVITACDSAAMEVCPTQPLSPVRVHWGYPDPSKIVVPDRAAAFEATRQSLSDRMLTLLELPLQRMSDADLEDALTYIGKS